jgi:hypothetical protein
MERRERLKNLTAKMVLESGEVPNFHDESDQYNKKKALFLYRKFMSLIGILDPNVYSPSAKNWPRRV